MPWLSAATASTNGLAPSAASTRPINARLRNRLSTKVQNATRTGVLVSCMA